MPIITYKKSGVSFTWDASCENILEASEAQGLNLPFGCRMGNCTACEQRLLEGKVEYPHGHAGMPDPGNALICCSVPRTDLVIDA